jgi:hypothetical protein
MTKKFLVSMMMIDFVMDLKMPASHWAFQRRCLHHIGHEQNPYEQAISIIGKTLPSFDEDNLIPVLDSEMVNEIHCCELPLFFRI